MEPSSPMVGQSGKRIAVVLLSGGLDSATTLAIARNEGFDVVALSFRYGQRHVIELQRAEQQAADAGVLKHVIIDVALAAVGHSALTDPSIAVPKHDSDLQIGGTIPITYVPARNTLFLAYALAWAEALSSHDIYIGVNALDYSGYPDCRPAFIEAFENLANLATKMGVEAAESSDPPAIRIHAPLIQLTKAEIIRRGLQLGVDYSRTSSCYDPAADGTACGHCDSCLLRKSGFAATGLTDPVAYAGGEQHAEQPAC